MKPFAYCVTVSFSELLADAKYRGIPLQGNYDYDGDPTTPHKVFLCPSSARVLATLGLRGFPGEPVIDRELLRDKCCMICGSPLTKNDAEVVVVVDDFTYPQTPELN